MPSNGAPTSSTPPLFLSPTLTMRQIMVQSRSPLDRRTKSVILTGMPRLAAYAHLTTLRTALEDNFVRYGCRTTCHSRWCSASHRDTYNTHNTSRYHTEAADTTPSEERCSKEREGRSRGAEAPREGDFKGAVSPYLPRVSAALSVNIFQAEDSRSDAGCKFAEGPRRAGAGRDDEEDTKEGPSQG